jgi:branched-chain amino acid transport system permease protein
LIPNQIAITGIYRIVVDIAMYFGLFLIVAMALNFQYGNAGIPNMGCAVQVIIGGFTISAITTRVTFIIIQKAGIELLPYSSSFDWVYNNNINVREITNEFLKNHPFLSISLIIFSLATAMILGTIIGWLISLPAIRLKSTYLIITLMTMADIAHIVGRNVPLIAGGTLGIHVPDLFKWYPGDRGVILSMITLLIGLVCFIIFRTMLNSPYGRLMRALRENEITLGSVGKDVVGIRRNILMLASGITAISGALLAFYFSFVVEANYARELFLGTLVVVLMRRFIIIYKWFFSKIFFFPISFFERMLLGLLLLIFIIFRPRGIIPEKLLYVPGINYRKLVREDAKVDWRVALKKKAKKHKYFLKRERKQ